MSDRVDGGARLRRRFPPLRRLRRAGDRGRRLRKATRRPIVACVALAIGVALKGVPLLLAPALLFWLAARSRLARSRVPGGPSAALCLVAVARSTAAIAGPHALDFYRYHSDRPAAAGDGLCGRPAASGAALSGIRLGHIQLRIGQSQPRWRSLGCGPPPACSRSSPSSQVTPSPICAFVEPRTIANGLPPPCGLSAPRWSPS